MADGRVGAVGNQSQGEFYELASAGRRHTEEEARNWKRVSVAIELALRDVEAV